MIRYDPAMLAIQGEKQLFLDDLLIETVCEITRTFHRPVEYEGNPVLKKDKPWERLVGGGNVFRDSRDNLFKCLYDDWTLLDWDDWKKCGHMRAENCILSVHYAVSQDGLQWEKPGPVPKLSRLAFASMVTVMKYLPTWIFALTVPPSRVTSL